uniref:Uncharacterized protein n=1 Tax=Moschus moschiferus TaxID=68415 RepID=A0A8C6E3D2_MOSMO
MAPDPWFSTYNSTCQTAQEIDEKIQQRSQYERNGENTTKNRTQALMPFPRL